MELTHRLCRNVVSHTRLPASFILCVCVLLCVCIRAGARPRPAIVSIATNGDLTYGSPVILATAPFTNCVTPADYHFQIDGTNRLITYHPETWHNGWHLGAVLYAANAHWLWQEMPSGLLDGHGTFDTNCNSAGGQFAVVNDDVFCVYQGEGWYRDPAGQAGRQGNQIFHYKTDGLFVGQFGMPAWDDVMINAIGSASNMRTISAVTVGGVTFLYVNDEQGRGTHRWRIE